MKRASFLIILLIIGQFVYSQTIINAERIMDGADSTIYSIKFSYNGTRGNSITDQLDISPAVVLLRKKNEYKMFGGYNLLSESGTGILNSGFVHLRHNYVLTKRIKTFEFYQIQFNNVLLLTRREVFGAGLRIALLNKDSLSSNINFGIMRELEVLDNTKLQAEELAETKYLRATIVHSLKIMISKNVRIDDVIYYQPYLKDFSDYRLLNDFNIAVSITNHFALIASLSTRYDSKPPLSLKNLDNLISFGFNVKF